MEKNRPTVRVEDLRVIVNSILTHISDDLGIAEIELSENYYWEVPEDSLYSVEKKFEELNVGSLYDDLEFLTPLRNNKDQVFALMLVHAAPLLRYIATKVGQ